MNSFGRIFRINIFGESHGEAIGGIIEGCLPGISLNFEAIQFEMTRRKPEMIPTPFVLNDAVIIKQKIKPSPKVDKEKASFRKFPTQRDSITVEVDTIKK